LSDIGNEFAAAGADFGKGWVSDNVCGGIEMKIIFNKYKYDKPTRRKN